MEQWPKGQSLTLGALGVFILWFAWFGFNGGSTLSATGDDAIFLMSKIFVTTKPVTIEKGDEVSDGKVREVVVVMNKNKFDVLKSSMEKIGITGMTLINAQGCGM